MFSTSYSIWLQGSMAPSWAFLAVASLLASSWLLGRLLLRDLLEIKLRSSTCDFLLHIGAGLNLWTLFSFALCACGLLNENVARVILPFSCFAALLYAKSLRREFHPEKIRSFLKREWPFLLFAAFLFVLCLGNALCPPAGLQVDEQTYQLPVPMRWLADRAPKVYADIPYSGYPSGPEFLFAIVMAAGKNGGPRLLSLCVHLLLLGALYFNLRRALAPLGALTLVFAFSFASAHMIFAGETYAEPFILFNFLCAALLLFERRPRGAGFLRGLGLGFFAGALAAAKLTALPACAVLGAGLLLLQREKLKQLAGFACGALFALPFYLRVWRETGNPFHPYLGWLFSADPAMIETSRHYHFMGGTELFGLPGWENALLAPLKVCFLPLVYDGDWGIQFLLLALLGAAAVVLAAKGALPRGRETLFCGAAFLLLLAVWTTTSQQARFLEIAAATLLFCAASFLQVLKKETRLWTLAALAAATLLSAPMTGWAAHYVKSWSLKISGISVASYLRGVWGNGLYEVYEHLDKAAKPEDKVMLLFEKRTLNCPRRFVVATPLFQAELFTPPPSGSPEEAAKEILAGVKRSGAKFVIVRTSFDKEESSPSVRKRLEPFWKGLELLAREKTLKTVWTDQAFTLLELAE